MYVMCRSQNGDFCDNSGVSGPISACAFAQPLSVKDLAEMLHGIDIGTIWPGSSLVFTQKREGCVSLRTRTYDGACAHTTEVRLVDTMTGSDWPFLPEDRPEIVRVNAKMCSAWGLDTRSICGVCVCTARGELGERGEAGMLLLRAAQQHVMHHLQRADACFCVDV